MSSCLRIMGRTHAREESRISLVRTKKTCDGYPDDKMTGKKKFKKKPDGEIFVP